VTVYVDVTVGKIVLLPSNVNSSSSRLELAVVVVCGDAADVVVVGGGGVLVGMLRPGVVLSLLYRLSL